MCKTVYLDDPSVGEREKQYVNAAIESGYVSTIGPYVPQFEEIFAKYLGVKRAVAVQSGTAALHIALYECGIREGDEVIVPALTFVASANPLCYLKAKPVFVDVDSTTWKMQPGLYGRWRQFGRVPVRTKDLSERVFLGEAEFFAKLEKRLTSRWAKEFRRLNIERMSIRLACAPKDVGLFNTNLENTND